MLRGGPGTAPPQGGGPERLVEGSQVDGVLAEGPLVVARGGREGGGGRGGLAYWREGFGGGGRAYRSAMQHLPSAVENIKECFEDRREEIS